MSDEDVATIVKQLYRMELRLSKDIVELRTKLDFMSSLNKDVTLIKIAIAVIYIVVIGKIAGIPIGNWVN